MTSQEIIKFVAEKLITQGQRSVAGNNPTICLYRGPEGRKCGAGWVIPDALYEYCMENHTILWVLQNYGEVEKAVLPTDLSLHEGQRLLIQIQSIHDDCLVEEWPEAFKNLGKRGVVDVDSYLDA
jgi:hypothetical protein